MSIGIVRRAVIAMLAGIGALALTATAQAQAPHERLEPLLIELPQWTAEAPEGMSLQAQGLEMIWASRQYKRGDAELNVVVGIGHPMAAQADAMREIGKAVYQAKGTSFEMDTMRGYQVARLHDKGERSGMIVVALAPGGGKGVTLILEYSSLDQREATALAERFDWAAMQRAALR